MITSEFTTIPELELCPQCNTEWSEHPLRCGLDDCQYIGLHCHKLIEIGGIKVKA